MESTKIANNSPSKFWLPSRKLRTHIQTRSTEGFLPLWFKFYELRINWIKDQTKFRRWEVWSFFGYPPGLAFLSWHLPQCFSALVESIWLPETKSWVETSENLFKDWMIWKTKSAFLFKPFLGLLFVSRKGRDSEVQKCRFFVKLHEWFFPCEGNSTLSIFEKHYDTIGSMLNFQSVTLVLRTGQSLFGMEKNLW